MTSSSRKPWQGDDGSTSSIALSDPTGPDQPVLISAEDLRQYQYCPRIVFFRFVLGWYPAKTTKMERGERVHEKQARKKDIEIENKGSLERYFNVWLQSQALGIQATLDCFEFDGTDIYPVEIKSGNVPRMEDGVVPAHHKIQLVAQSLLLEDAFAIPVWKAKVRYVDHHVVKDVQITIDEKRLVMNAIKNIRAMVASCIPPDPTPHGGKCVDCEYWSACYRT
nr:CRISPR-associated protein Cas4 [Candidatus Sigynarchaeota archaeon]